MTTLKTCTVFTFAILTAGLLSVSPSAVAQGLPPAVKQNGAAPQKPVNTIGMEVNRRNMQPDTYQERSIFPAA
jgi:hypothetical protein